MPSVEQVTKQLFSDRKWFAKCLIGGVLGLVPVVQIVSLGYLHRLFLRGMEGRPFVLPEWEDWQGLFVDGLKLLAVCLVFAVVPLGALWLIAGSLPGNRWLAQIPIIPVGFLAGPAAGAALFLWTRSGDFRNCFNFNILGKMLRQAAWRYAVPTFAFLGILLLGWAIAPFVFFFGGAIYGYILAAAFRSLEGQR